MPWSSVNAADFVPYVSEKGSDTLQIRDVLMEQYPQLRPFVGWGAVDRVNAYVSMAGAECHEHSEAYPVLVVQAAGSKIWHVDGDRLTLHRGDLLYMDPNTCHSTATPDFSIHFTLKLRFQLPNSGSDS